MIMNRTNHLRNVSSILTQAAAEKGFEREIAKLKHEDINKLVLQSGLKRRRDNRGYFFSGSFFSGSGKATVEGSP